MLLLLALAIIIAAMIYFKRRKMNPDKKDSLSSRFFLFKLIDLLKRILFCLIHSSGKISERVSLFRSNQFIGLDDFFCSSKQGKPRWKNLPIDYSKYKNESSSSTSHLVETAESNSAQVPPPIPARPSPMTSTHSSYRQAPSTSVSLSYRQASALPGFRLPPPTRSYSPEREDDVSTSVNAMPLSTSRSKTNTPFGSHRSLSESIQSLRSNQQPAVCLPVKKRSNDLPLRSAEVKKDYQHHHYHNPAELIPKSDNTSSEEEEEFEQQQRINQTSNLPAVCTIL